MNFNTRHIYTWELLLSNERGGGKKQRDGLKTYWPAAKCCGTSSQIHVRWRTPYGSPEQHNTPPKHGSLLPHTYSRAACKKRCRQTSDVKETRICDKNGMCVTACLSRSNGWFETEQRAEAGRWGHRATLTAHGTEGFPEGGRLLL